MYVVPNSLGVAAKFRIPRPADRTYLGLYTSTHVSIASCMMLVDVDLVVCLAVGGRHSHPGRCSWGALWEREAVVVIGNASHGPSQLAMVVMGLAPPPLRNNLPVGCWPPLEQCDNQPLMDWPPLGLVLPPLEGELFGMLLVLRVLCCIVPLLLQLHFLPPRFW
jgi:hypothetical protein